MVIALALGKPTENDMWTPGKKILWRASTRTRDSLAIIQVSASRRYRLIKKPTSYTKRKKPLSEEFLEF